MNIDLLNPNPEHLLAKWRHVIDQVRPISEWTSDVEIAWLCEAAQGKDVVGEVGSYKGKSARAMALAGANRIICADRFQDGTGGIFEDRLRDFIISGTVILFACESKEAASAVETMQSADDIKKFDFFFIDASHAKEDVIRDIDLWMPLMKPGGILAFHDCHPQDQNNGVHPALIEKLPNYTLIVDSIAAVKMPESCAEIVRNLRNEWK